MFWMAFYFLVVASGVLHRGREGFGTSLELYVMFWSLVVLWPIFIVEAAARFFLCERRTGFWHRFSYFLLVSVLPPMRLAARSYADQGRMWLPLVGWAAVDKTLRRTLERLFSAPMIVIALMVLPVLAMEYFWLEPVRAHFGWSLTLDIASSVIWLAFALEFVIMVSVAPGKVRYCFQNWTDMLVVALPIVDFLPLLRLFRLTRILELQQLSRMGRLYRLRGLLMKLWRAILVLEMIQRLFGNYKERRLKKLKDLLVAREEELLELRAEIRELEGALAKAADRQAPAEAPRTLENQRNSWGLEPAPEQNPTA
jgi:voltage-gated potassium channel